MYSTLGYRVVAWTYATEIELRFLPSKRAIEILRDSLPLFYLHGKESMFKSYYTLSRDY